MRSCLSCRLASASRRAADCWLSGSRDYDPRVGRWSARDPILFGGGDSNLYAYAFGDPINFRDADGRDAIHVVYDGYPIDTGLGFDAPFGHAAVVAVNPEDGFTQYYEYGRYGTKFGRVRRRWVPNVEIGDDGRPTPESLEDLYDFMSTNYGKDSEVSATYYSDANYKKIVDYARRVMNDPKRQRYSLLRNNCFSFAADAIEAGQRAE